MEALSKDSSPFQEAYTQLDSMAKESNWSFDLMTLKQDCKGSASKLEKALRYAGMKNCFIYYN